MGRYRYIFYCLCFFAVAIPFAYYTPDIDMAVSSYFYDQENLFFPSNAFYDFISAWGVVPAQITAVAAAIVLVISLLLPSWADLRKYALLLILPMVLGAGLIVHPLLKDHWGRPRPRQVDLLGGSESFRPFYRPNFTWKSHHKSFPCGHCTMGFYFFCVSFLGMRLKRRLMAFGALLLAIGLGVALSLARIAQGGHFFSDTVTAAVIMLLVALASDRYLFGHPRKEHCIACKG